MNLSELTQAAQEGQVESLDLISLDTFYILEIHLPDQKRRLLDGRGQVMHLRSVEHARDLLESLPEVPFHLVHASPYDEMCGLAEGRREPLRLPIALRSAWGEVRRRPEQGG